jgi:hypothetical protein
MDSAVIVGKTNPIVFAITSNAAQPSGDRFSGGNICTTGYTHVHSSTSF